MIRTIRKYHEGYLQTSADRYQDAGRSGRCYPSFPIGKGQPDPLVEYELKAMGITHEAEGSAGL